MYLSLNAAPEFQRISSLGENLNFQRIRVLGEVMATRVKPGKYDSYLTILITLRQTALPGEEPSSPASYSPGGEIRLKAEGRIARELDDSKAIPLIGDVVDVWATLFAGSGYRLLSLGDPQFLRVVGETRSARKFDDVSLPALMSSPETFKDKNVRITEAIVVKREGKLGIALRSPDGKATLKVFGVSDRVTNVGDRISIRGQFLYFKPGQLWELKTHRGDREAVQVLTRGNQSGSHTEATVEGLLSNPEPLRDKPVRLKEVEIGQRVNDYCIAVKDPEGDKELLVFGVKDKRWQAGDRVSVRGTFFFYEMKKKSGPKSTPATAATSGSAGAQATSSSTTASTTAVGSGSPRGPRKPRGYWEIKTAFGDRRAVVAAGDGGAAASAASKSAEASRQVRKTVTHKAGTSVVTPWLAGASIAAAIVGGFVAAIFSLIPGLHIFNVIAITMLITFQAMSLFSTLAPLILTGFLLGMVVTFSVLFTVSSQYFQPSDESFRSIVLPHERLLFDGRAHEAVMLGGIGGLTALFFMTLVLPVVSGFVSGLVRFLQPHHYWIVATICTHLLITEWPKDHGAGKTAWQRLCDGWVQLLMGYFTFFAAGLLGILVFHRTMVPLDGAFQSLMPLFVGLFAIPSHIMAFITRTTVPPQHMCTSVELYGKDVVKGGFSGLLAGCFATVTPGLTPGPALLLSGHATSQQGERQFIIGGGAARVMYYAGAMILLFLPGVFLRRGGAAINISLIFIPEAPEQFYLVTGIIALVGAFSFIALVPYSRLCAALSQRVPFQTFSAIGSIFLVILVGMVTGGQGLLLMAVATLLGLVPNMWHTRRISLLAVLLVPMFLNMSGLGPAAARFLGLN